MSKRRSAESNFLLVLQSVHNTPREGITALELLEAAQRVNAESSIFNQIGNRVLSLVGKPSRAYKPSYRAHLHPTLARLERQEVVESEFVEAPDSPSGKKRAYKLAEPMFSLREAIGDELGLEPAQIRPDDTPESLDADSLDIVEVVIALEEKFGINLSDDELRQLKTVRDLHRLVKSKLNQVGYRHTN